MALKRIGDVLIQEKVITQDKLNFALKNKEKDERLEKHWFVSKLLMKCKF